MLNLLYKFQSLLNAFAENPLTLGISLGFLIGWTTTSLVSHGVFDPGLGIENLIINGLSVLLLFASCSSHASHKESIYDLHEKIDNLHEKLDR